MSQACFAVVGRPNKGKSSIVATLSRDDSVLIEARSGSTRHARRFPMKVDGQVLYTLVDTPGIQRAREVLAWLQAHCDDAAGRPAAVQHFVESHRGDARFVDECELLQPIIDGAGIIYVVDGSCPFAADYEAEMEILRWTGRPSLALINPIDNDDYADQWSAGLGQFFRTVRRFDAQRAEFGKQLELLELFGHLDPQWRRPLERAVSLLRADRDSQHHRASLLIAQWLAEALTYRVSQRLPEGSPEAVVKKLLFKRYCSHLARREQQCRRQIEELYHYRKLSRSEQELALEESDLFNTDLWFLWGLNRRSLTLVAGSAGAVLGGATGLAVDSVTGGLLGGLATLTSGAVGAVSGGLGAWRRADDIAQWRVKGVPAGGSQLSYGPSRNLNFPFVLLGRALQHQRLLCERTHADRSELALPDAPLEQVDDRQRRRLARIFAELREQRLSKERQAELAQMLLDWCRGHDRESAPGLSEQGFS